MSAPAEFARQDVWRRGRDAFCLARPLLGEHEDIDSEPARDLRTLDGQLAVLTGVLRDRLHVDAESTAESTTGSTTGRQVVLLSQALHDLLAARFAIHDHLVQERALRLEAVDLGLATLRRVGEQDELLDTVCRVVVEHCGFDRVMLSRVEDQVWRPWRSHARELGSREQAFADWIGALPAIRLRSLLLEYDMVRQRRPAIVRDANRDARVYPPLLQSSGLTSYVAAPILSGERVIGLLHADRVDSEVDELDREVLWVFAVGFAQVFERSVLLSRLREQHAEVVRAMRAVESVLEQLTSAEIDLTAPLPAPRERASQAARALAAERHEALKSVLTARELEVLSLMATGATNERIAQQLVIATGTVKTHVKQILRKLRVENRAEAISRYLRLTMGASGR